MGDIASQITSLVIVYSTVYSGTDQRKHQSTVSLALKFTEIVKSKREQCFSNVTRGFLKQPLEE